MGWFPGTPFILKSNDDPHSGLYVRQILLEARNHGKIFFICHYDVKKWPSRCVPKVGIFSIAHTLVAKIME